jgi:hypothetical protein
MAYEFERDEWKSAVAQMSELERVAACGHYWNRKGMCVYCGESADD